ncbi:MAG: molybdate ABC transporter substrate-binding protein [Anaerolineae bacterium]
MKLLFRRWVLLIAVGLLLAACSTPGAPDTASAPKDLVVFAAASLTNAFEELADSFEAENPGVDVVLNFAGSQQLAQQLGQGAAADLFASANNSQMQAAIDTGRIVSGTQQIFAGNRLVVITPASNPAGLTSLQDLTQPGIKLVLAAKEVPVGSYSLDFLEKASASPQFTPDYSAAVLANVVSYEENVRAVLSKVALGEADAGIVYSSDVTPDVSSQVLRIQIPDELNTLAAYPIAPIADAPNPELARQFLALVLSPEGQAVLASHGFIPLE